MKKKAFGIVLLILAALILLQGNFGIPSFTNSQSVFILC